MSLADLEQTGILQILAFLQKNGSATRTDLRDNVKAVMETIYSALNTLRRLELIEEEESKRFPFTRKVWLNKRGRTVGQSLSEIEQTIASK